MGLAAVRPRGFTINQEPIRLDARQATLAEVDKELADAGLLDPRTGSPTEEIIAALSWEREELLPTPGLMVKGCLDECDTCESALKRQIELELEEQALRNKMLGRQIELLEHAQEYRCCSEGESEQVVGDSE